MNDQINSIIRLNLCPLHETKQGNDYYEPSFRELGVVKEQFNSHYNIRFNVPIFSAKVKYYKRLIDNAITNKLNEHFAKQQTPDLIAFWRKKIYETTQNYLTDIRQIVEDNVLDLDDIFNQRNYSVTPQKNECTYIFHYLILSLIRYYMEFQQHYIHDLDPDKLVDIDTFFVQVLQWRTPDNVGLEKIQQIEIEQVQEVEKRKDENEILAFTYTKLNSNPDNITYLMDSLKKSNFIATDTSITDFKHVFSGKKVDNPIRWTTHFGGLLDLFRKLKKNNLIQFDGNNMYKIVAACFVDENGDTFEENKFRNGKISKEITERITKAVNLME